MHAQRWQRSTAGQRPTPEPPVPIEERRARIQRWTRFAALAHITRGKSEGGGHCTICERFIDPGELDFIIIFEGAVTLRLDSACMDLWHEERERPPSAS
jgi:hypothetical protein